MRARLSSALNVYVSVSDRWLQLQSGSDHIYTLHGQLSVVCFSRQCPVRFLQSLDVYFRAYARADNPCISVSFCVFMCAHALLPAHAGHVHSQRRISHARDARRRRSACLFACMLVLFHC